MRGDRRLERDGARFEHCRATSTMDSAFDLVPLVAFTQTFIAMVIFVRLIPRLLSSVRSRTPA